MIGRGHTCSSGWSFSGCWRWSWSRSSCNSRGGFAAFYETYGTSSILLLVGFELDSDVSIAFLDFEFLLTEPIQIFSWVSDQMKGFVIIKRIWVSYLLVLTPFFVCTETPSISPLPRLNSSQSKSSCLQVASISYLTWQFTLLVYWSPSWVKKEKASSAPTEIEVEDLPSGQTYSEWKKINH